MFLLTLKTIPLFLLTLKDVSIDFEVYSDVSIDFCDVSDSSIDFEHFNDLRLGGLDFSIDFILMYLFRHYSNPFLQVKMACPQVQAKQSMQRLLFINSHTHTHALSHGKVKMTCPQV